MCVIKKNWGGGGITFYIFIKYKRKKRIFQNYELYFIQFVSIIKTEISQFSYNFFILAYFKHFTSL